MDKILMQNLGFYAYHGLLKEESVLGQKFFLDIELEVKKMIRNVIQKAHGLNQKVVKMSMKLILRLRL